MSEHKLRPFEVNHGSDPELPWQQVSFGHHDPEAFVQLLNETNGTEYAPDDAAHEWWVAEMADGVFHRERCFRPVEEGTTGAIPVTVVMIP